MTTTTEEEKKRKGVESSTTTTTTKKPKLITPVSIEHVPTKAMTGLDPFYTQLCAQLSADMYKPEVELDSTSFCLDQGYDLDKVGLTTAPEVVLFDKRWVATNPPFVAVVAGTTMILAWRGSHTAMDWDRNIGFYASSSFRWKPIAKVVKVHGAYLSLVENTMIEHEDELVTIIQARNITELICTGHSLGGGVATVAQLWLEGSMHQSGDKNSSTNPWKKVSDTLTIRSLSFEGPATTVFLKSKKEEDDLTNQHGLQFLTTCARNMCTTAYANDGIPRSLGNPQFLLDEANDVLDAVEEDAGFLRKLPTALIVNKLKKFAKEHGAGVVQPYLDLVKMYQHLGTVVHYADPSAVPIVHVDDRAGVLLRTVGVDSHAAAPQFNSIPFTGEVMPTEAKADKSVLNNPAQAAYYNHMCIVTGPGLSLQYEDFMGEHAVL